MAVNGPSKSLSKALREEGNKVFSSVDQNLAPVLRRFRFEQALQKYNQALNAAQNVDERVSADKNVAVVNSKLAKLVDPMRELQLLIYYLKNASEHFSKSYNLSDGVKSNEWKRQLLSSIFAFLEGIDDIASTLSFQKKMSLFEASVYSFEITSVRAEFCFRIAEMYFHESVYRVEAKDFRSCLSRLGDCYRPIAEIEKIDSCDPALQIKVETLKTDVRYQTCWAESLQAIHVGDRLYADYFHEKSEFNCDDGWIVYDCYKEAILLSHELEVETEAMATSRIGRIYSTVFGLKYRGKEHYKLAIELALTMHPKSFHNCEWFKEATEMLERYQQEQLEEESKLWHNERKKYVDELEKELKVLETKAKMSDLELIKWIYKSHPPKNKKHTLPKKLPCLKEGKEKYDKGMESLLRKAIIHYHPDKSDPEGNGKKWKVLCEEISKYLSARYNAFKGVD